MIRSTTLYFLAGFLAVLMTGQYDGAACQDFPYSVPQAPEFDGRGAYIRTPEQGESPAPRRAYRQAPSTDSNENGVSYRTERPYVPEENVPEAPAPTPRSVARTQPLPPRAPEAAPPMPGYGPPPSQTPPPMSSLPQQLPQIQSGPDCSQFPMLIARSQSDAEMQFTARRYLTCLMQNGWNAEQAKQHVIKTIESTYAARR